MHLALFQPMVANLDFCQPRSQWPTGQRGAAPRFFLFSPATAKAVPGSVGRLSVGGASETHGKEPPPIRTALAVTGMSHPSPLGCWRQGEALLRKQPFAGTKPSFFVACVAASLLQLPAHIGKRANHLRALEFCATLFSPRW